MEQRTCNAYIISICQPEAIFNYSNANQSKVPSNDNISFINKQIQWQLDNKLRGSCFKAIELSTIKLFIFVDRSFANNKD